LSINHGGVAIVACPGICLSPVNLAASPTTFEAAAARLVEGSFSVTIVVIYRPGSAAVHTQFFEEFSALLDIVAILQERVFLVGDVNIRCDRSDDPTTVQFLDLFSVTDSVYSPLHPRTWRVAPLTLL
jgi:exonuclease III